jgi:hypothetical protein
MPATRAEWRDDVDSGRHDDLGLLNLRSRFVIGVAGLVGIQDDVARAGHGQDIAATWSHDRTGE